MLDQHSLGILEPWEVLAECELPAERPMCATCAADDTLHVVRTPLGMGCPWTGCRQFVAVN